MNERLTKREKCKLSHGEEIVICKHTDEECNDSCMKIIPCAWYEKAMEKLAEYEELEEQGLLLRLPARNIFESNGDTVYYIYDFEIVECINCGLNIDCEGNIWIALACDEDIFPYRNPDAEHDLDPTDWCKNTIEVKAEEWGKTVFLTQFEAEEKLRELESQP